MERNGKILPGISMAILIAATIVPILLTAATTRTTITPLAAYAYSSSGFGQDESIARGKPLTALKIPGSSSTDDGISALSLTDPNTINNADSGSIAKVKPPEGLKIPGNTGNGVVSPISRNIAALGDKWWNWALSIDTTKEGNPFTDTTGELCSLGEQQGNLLFLVGTAGETSTSSGTSGHTGDVRTCDTPIPRGTTLFFPLVNTECSVLEGNYDPKQPGSVDKQLRACATDVIDHVPKSSLVLTIDGVSSKQLIQRAQSPPGGFQLTVRPNNPFITASDSPLNVKSPITTTSVADGYWALLKATTLSRGPHTITFGGEADFPEFDFKFRTEVTYRIVVK
jgi:hypothetical protein